MKIAYIAGTLGQGGAERQLYYFIKSLIIDGHKIKCFCLTKDEFYQEQIEKLGVEVIWFGQSTSKIKRLKNLWNLISNFKPDIIHSQHFYTNLYGCLIGRLKNITSFGSFRNNYTDEVKSNGKILGNLSVIVPKKIISNSYEAIQNAINAGVDNKKLLYLSNVVDENIFHQFTKRVINKNEIIKILSIGRFNRQKRYDRSITIIDLLAKKYPDVLFEYNIYGKGELESIISQWALAIEAKNLKVNIYPPTSNTALVYNQHHFFLLASDYEGTPNVVLESMSTGLPVISSKVGNLNFMFHNEEKGSKPIILVQKDDIGKYVESFSSLMDNEKAYSQLSEDGLTFAKNNLSISNLSKRLISIYTKTND